MVIKIFEIIVKRNEVTYKSNSLISAIKKALDLKKVFNSDIEINEITELINN